MIDGFEDDPLWASAAAARQVGVARLKERLRPLVRAMLEEARGQGVAPHEVRFAAEARGWLTGQESGRYLSFLAGLFKQAGAVPQGYVVSQHPRRHHAPTRLWVLKAFAVDLTGGPRR